MALSILRRGGVNIFHTPAHDLESMCYAFFHALTCCDGPFGKLRDIKASSISLPMLEWYQNHNDISYRKLGRIKQGQLADAETNIFDHFTPYFNNLKPLARDLFKALFPNGPLGFAPEPKITHETMLRIFDETIRLLKRHGDGHTPPTLYPLVNRSKSRIRSPPRPRSGGPTYPDRKKRPMRLLSADASEHSDKRSRTDGSTDYSVVSGDPILQGSAGTSASAISSEANQPSAALVQKPVRHGSSTKRGRK